MIESKAKSWVKLVAHERKVEGGNLICEGEEGGVSPFLCVFCLRQIIILFTASNLQYFSE